MTSKATYAERLESYVQALPSETKNRLIIRLATVLFNEITATGPGRLDAFDEARRVLKDLEPGLHQPYDRAALTTALGDYLIEWWGEMQQRPLTGHDLDQLLDELPETGVREALKRFAERAVVEP